MFKEGRDLGMLMISANWLGLGWLLWGKGNQRQTAICLETFHPSPLRQRLFRGSHTRPLSALCSITQRRPRSPSVPRPGPALPAEPERPRRCPERGDNGKPQLGAALALALSLSPSAATQGAPPRQFTTSRSSPAARKWLDTFESLSPWTVRLL